MGRVLVTTTYGWVFGIIEDKPNGKLFLQMVRYRDRETLEPLIESRIRKGTTVFSDSWPSYHNLMNLGYKHYQVNHKKHFIEVQDEILTQSQINQNVMNQVVRMEQQSDDAEDTSDQQPENIVNVNTQRIERAWREVKRGLQGQPLSLLRRNLNVEMFRFNNLTSNMSFEEKRDVVLRVLGKHQSSLEGLNTLSFSIYDD